jgi:hypothetical protein
LCLWDQDTLDVSRSCVIVFDSIGGRYPMVEKQVKALIGGLSREDPSHAVDASQVLTLPFYYPEVCSPDCNTANLC